MLWFIALFWIICGVMAYGMLLHNIHVRRLDTNPEKGADKSDIQWALSWSASGPLIIIVLILVSILDGENYLDGFKWVNPVKGFRG